MSEKLPMSGTGPDEQPRVRGEGEAEGRNADVTGGGGAPPSLSQVPAWRLIGTLTVAGTLAGLFIVLVFQWANPRIQAHRAARLQEAVQEVLGDPARYETLFVHEGRLTSELPPGRDTLDTERVFLGYDENGTPMGFAVLGSKPGFQDVIELIFGYDAGREEVLGMKVLESKETPGLGDKIEKDSSFVGAFEGAKAPLSAIKPGSGDGSAGEVDMITGATISSRAVIEIINQRISEVGPLLQSYRPPAGARGDAGAPADRTAEAPRGPGGRP